MDRPNFAARPVPRPPRRPAGRPAAHDGPGPRERLLASAGVLFPSKGIGAVGIDELVRHAGVARMSLYHHFGSKEGLVAEYLESVHNAWFSWLQRESQRPGDTPRESILNIFEALADWHQTPGYFGCPFARAQGELGDTTGPIRTAMDRHQNELVQWLTELCRLSGVRDPANTASQISILVHGANTCAAPQRSPEHARLARQMAAALLAG